MFQGQFSKAAFYWAPPKLQALMAFGKCPCSYGALKKVNGLGSRLSQRRSLTTCRALQHQVVGEFDSSFSDLVRKETDIYGLIPPKTESPAIQSLRCLKQLALKESSIEKYLYLSTLRRTNVHLFYRLVTEHIKDLTPIIYTPTVGEACLQWSHNFVQPEGLYISYKDKGRIRKVLDNWRQEHVEITVVTDGSRVLGLGDLGINSMGIPVGKLALYIACAGIRPEATLPLVLDTGTANQSLIEDPLYMGSRTARISIEQDLEFMDELMRELRDKWPGIVIQFEDFKNPVPALERYRDSYTCFNDDIQGTGAVVLAGMVNAIRQSQIDAKDHRIVMFGAGSAGVGVTRQIFEFFVQQGLTEDEARRRFWLVDSKGLVTRSRAGHLAQHKAYFARDDAPHGNFKTLEQVVDLVKPTILMGLSTIGGSFTARILQKMAAWNRRPIIFPLSNPSASSECTFKEAVEHTQGRVLFASGSPFSAFHYNHALKSPGQGNNMYVFPGIGLGTILSKAEIVTSSMVYAAALALSSSLDEEEQSQGSLYPEIPRIRDVSVLVAMGVIRAAEEAHVARETCTKTMDDRELEAWIRARMYEPHKESARLDQLFRK